MEIESKKAIKEVIFMEEIVKVIPSWAPNVGLFMREYKIITTDYNYEHVPAISLSGTPKVGAFLKPDPVRSDCYMIVGRKRAMKSL